MGKYIDLTGRIFHRLTVESKKITDNKKRDTIWHCKCSCGNSADVRATSLLSGYTHSCGCLRKEASYNKRKYNTYDLTGKIGIGYTKNRTKFYFDLEDYDKIKSYNWHISKQGYLCCTTVNPNIKLHRFILDIQYPNIVVDHINGDILDNCKINLRTVSIQQNASNAKLRTDNTSGHKGVKWNARNNKWASQINYKNKRYHLGFYDNIDNAVHIREIAELKLFGEYSRRYEELKSKYKDIDLSNYNF